MTATTPATTRSSAPTTTPANAPTATLTPTPTTTRLPRIADLMSVDDINPWTVMSGSLILSAIAARAIAWFDGTTTMVQLALLLVIAVVAAITGRKAEEAADGGRIDVLLGRLCVRAGLVQTALGVMTLAAALF